MTKLIHKTGDIFTTEAGAIGHGVNVVGAMGSGIALEFKRRFPVMHEHYVNECNMGALLPGTVMPWKLESGHYIYNIASQHFPGANAKMIWLMSGTIAAVQHAAFTGIPVIALPRIGSGIGGLNQDKVEQTLEVIAAASEIDIELWTLPRKKD